MFNDVYEIHDRKSGLGGFSRFSMLLEEERAKSKHHITTLNGDFLFPSVLSTFDRAKHRIELFNMMDIDLAVLGNHEFDFGPEVVKERLAESNFLWFGANVYDLYGNYFTGDKQTYIVEVDGIRIGFFGIVTNDTPILSSTNNSALFCPLALTAQRMVEELRMQGCDVVVALTHLYVNEDRALAREVDGIDVILGGHDHDPYICYENRTLLMKVGQNADFLGRIDLKLIKEDDGKVKIYPNWKVIANHGYPTNPEMDAVIAKIDASFEQSTSKPLAVLEGELDSRNEVVREGEAAIGNLFADALREILNADVAILSGGMMRGGMVYPKGYKFAYRDLLHELPFDNQAVLTELSGRDILEGLENGVSQAGEFAGRFPQVSGIEFFFNPNQPVGQRVIEAKVNGDLLQPKSIYRVATVTYNLRGGDGYHSFTNGNVLISADEGGSLVDLLSRYFLQKRQIKPVLENRIQSISFRGRLLDSKKESRK